MVLGKYNGVVQVRQTAFPIILIEYNVECSMKCH